MLNSPLTKPTFPDGGGTGTLNKAGRGHHVKRECFVASMIASKSWPVLTETSLLSNVTCHRQRKKKQKHGFPIFSESLPWCFIMFYFNDFGSQL